MPDLEAVFIGGEPRSWRLPIDNRPMSLGRLPEKNELPVEWDPLISRQHATLQWQGDHLVVRRDEAARNPIYFEGRVIERGEAFSMQLEQCFQIGDTRFTLVQTAEEISEDGRTISADELERFQFNDPAKCIKALSELPRLIGHGQDAEDLADSALSVLLNGLELAQVVAILRVEEFPEFKFEPRRWRSRADSATPFRPSMRLIKSAVLKHRDPVWHDWLTSEGGSQLPGEPGPYTTPNEHNWAICCPLPDEPEPGWALYAAGKRPHVTKFGSSIIRQQSLEADVRFVKLVADLVGAIRLLEVLRARQAVLESILSSQVVQAIKHNPELLKERTARVTVLFCDLRGSCRIAEDAQDLHTLWQRVGQALQFMTAGITDHDGTIGDFQGDAAMGFWGWPVPHEDQASRAAHAALGIQKDFERHALPGAALAGLRTGIGIAHGEAFAGFLGTHDQKKVSVFGAVVNLASRLESLTKQWGVAILLDEPAALALQDHTRSWARLRKLARVRPAGMISAHTIYELLPPESQKARLKDPELRDYAAGLAFFLEGRWDDARQLFQRLHDDGPSAFLLSFMTRHQGTPPNGWAADPVITMEAK